MEINNYENDLAEYAKRYVEIVSDPLFEKIELTNVPEIIQQNVKGTLTLDYGCGPGNTALFLKSLGLDVEGVDINAYMIEAAKQMDPCGRYELITSAKIPRPDNYYDFAFSCWALVHVATKEELIKICKEIGRVLKPEGVFILILHSDEGYDKEWLTIDTRFEINKNISSGSVVATQFKRNNYTVYSYYWTEQDYIEVLTKAGLKIVRTAKPLGTDNDGYAWVNEKHVPYVTIYVAQKV